MKTKILSTLKILCAVIITLGALHVFANGYSYTGYNEPSSQGENAFRPVNVSSEDQVMASSFYSKSFLKAGNSVAVPAPFTAASPTWNNSSAFVAEKSIISPRAIINRYLFLPGKNSQVKVGSSGSSLNPNLPPSQPFTGDLTTPLIIDMKGRGSGVNDRSGREAMQFSSGSVGTTVLVNTPAIQFSSTKNVSTDSGVAKADIIAGALALNDNAVAPGAVRVLVATDTSGNAVWGSMAVVTENGVKKIKVSYGDSVVQTGQNMCGSVTPPVTDLCPNINGTQTSVPNGMVVDASGNCVTPPPTDVCPNIAGVQTTVPTGMIVDGSGNCVTPPADLCTNIDGVQLTLPIGMLSIRGSNNSKDCHIYCLPSLRPDFNHNSPYYCIYETGGSTGADVDLCNNISGSQSSIPTGMTTTSSGGCVTSTIDICPNINGTQTTIPDGRIKDVSGNCVVSSCSNIDSIRQYLPGEYPGASTNGIPNGYTLQSDGMCRPIVYWLYTDGVHQPGNFTWLNWTKFGSSGDKPGMIQYTSSDNFHKPYCTSINYRPGDKYFKGGAICAEYGVTPDASAYSSTATPQLQGCSNYPDLYMKPCN